MALRLDNRENARIVEMCYKDHTTLINPIIDWTTDEVWEFIREYKIPTENFKEPIQIGQI